MTENSNRSIRDEPIRLFKSNLLEFFTHINPVIVLVIWIPVIVFFLLFGTYPQKNLPWFLMLTSWVIGFLIWTPAEYLLHRFIFHFHPKNPSEKLKRILFLAHGVHHAQPRVKTRLVMPPVLSIPLAALFLGLFWLIVGKLLLSPRWVDGMFAGFLSGYIFYDIGHYSLHHFTLRGNYFRSLRQHHMAHHFKSSQKLFGVSTKFWDRVFKTLN